ncbi:MAG TPA: hypothetical protein PK796_09020, partial [Bacteroidales bacterium]|nr:hypothetical protein [Bacteroidales bacterium]
MPLRALSTSVVPLNPDTIGTQTIEFSLPSLQCISSVPLSALSVSVVPFYPVTIKLSNSLCL